MTRQAAHSSRARCTVSCSTLHHRYHSARGDGNWDKLLRRIGGDQAHLQTNAEYDELQNRGSRPVHEAGGELVANAIAIGSLLHELPYRLAPLVEGLHCCTSDVACGRGAGSQRASPSLFYRPGWRHRISNFTRNSGATWGSTCPVRDRSCQVHGPMSDLQLQTPYVLTGLPLPCAWNKCTALLLALTEL